MKEHEIELASPDEVELIAATVRAEQQQRLRRQTPDEQRASVYRRMQRIIPDVA